MSLLHKLLFHQTVGGIYAHTVVIAILELRSVFLIYEAILALRNNDIMS
ncbi:hypothetical protein IR120_03720 [Muribacter muris]|nr:hypothetical protein [Muribacter muris]MBF0784580.1 hypothetical protein [Muribacter muris]MBF0828220.1 hypothetical protein [Muribacter muris]